MPFASRPSPWRWCDSRFIWGTSYGRPCSCWEVRHGGKRRFSMGRDLPKPGGTTCFTFFFYDIPNFGEKSDVEEAKRHFFGGIWEIQNSTKPVRMAGRVHQFWLFGSRRSVRRWVFPKVAASHWLVPKIPWVHETQNGHAIGQFRISHLPKSSFAALVWPQESHLCEITFFQGENAILRLEILCRTSSDVARPQDASSAAKLGAAQSPGGVPLRALRLQVGRQRWVGQLAADWWPCLGKNCWHPKIRP